MPLACMHSAMPLRIAGLCRGARAFSVSRLRGNAASMPQAMRLHEDVAQNTAPEAVPESEQKLLQVGVVGVPNAGKSTLTNALVGTKVRHPGPALQACPARGVAGMLLALRLAWGRGEQQAGAPPPPRCTAGVSRVPQDKHDAFLSVGSVHGRHGTGGPVRHPRRGRQRVSGAGLGAAGALRLAGMELHGGILQCQLYTPHRTRALCRQLRGAGHETRVMSAWGTASSCDMMLFIVDAHRQVCVWEKRGEEAGF